MIQYSQRDPRWAKDKLGFADAGQTIESYGCLLTASAFVLTYHGFTVNPQELNKKLQANGGFTGALMYFGVLANLYPVRVNLINCGKDNSAPLPLINASLDTGRPVIVEVDASPRTGFQNHWVTIYKRDQSRYYISDPWTYQPENENATLEDKYGWAGRPEQIISNVFQVEPIKATPVTSAPVVDEPKIPPAHIASGGKLRVSIDGLRLRLGPSTGAQEITLLNTGMVLQSGGDQVGSVDGVINWQPVILYVAANYRNDQYIEAVK